MILNTWNNAYASDEINFVAAKDAASSINIFAFDLYKELVRDKDASIFFSPYGISTAMSMLYLGATETAKEEMQKVLHYQNNNHYLMMNLRKTLQLKINHNPLSNDLYETARANSGTTPSKLLIANAVWPSINIDLLQKYKENINQYFDGEVIQLDYINNSEESEVIINKWVSDKTNNKIESIFPKGAFNLGNLTRTSMIITNAIYFKADWRFPFNKSETRQDIFYGIDGNILVDMMKTSIHGIKYSETETFQIVNLPYIAINCGMIIILPKEISLLSTIESMLSAEKYYDYLASGIETNVNLFMPKFIMNIDLKLSVYFAKLGFKSLFSSSQNNNFNNMLSTEKGMSINDIFHKTFITIDENGTEASSTSAILLQILGAMHQDVAYTEFRANHPFIYFIMDYDTNTILFMGRYMGDI
jgi:serpin B